MAFSLYPLIDRNSNFEKRFGKNFKSLPKTHDLDEKVSLNLLDGREGIFSCNPWFKCVFLSESHFYKERKPIVPLSLKSVEPPSVVTEFESVEFPCMAISCFSIGTSTEQDSYGEKVLLKFDEIPVSENLSENVFVYEFLSVEDILLKGKAYSSFVRTSVIRLSKMKTAKELGALISSIKEFSLCS